MQGPHDPSALDRLLEARRRYSALRDALPCNCPIDRDLHAELTEAIRLLDAKIAGTDPFTSFNSPPCGASTTDGRSAGCQAPARRHRSAR